MIVSNSTMSKQIAEAAMASELKRTGHAPQSVTVVLTENTLVITLHGSLSEAEKAVAKNPVGAAQVQEFHKQLFANSSDWLREEIKRITGVAVREATAEIRDLRADPRPRPRVDRETWSGAQANTPPLKWSI